GRSSESASATSGAPVMSSSRAARRFWAASKRARNGSPSGAMRIMARDLPSGSRSATNGAPSRPTPTAPRAAPPASARATRARPAAGPDAEQGARLLPLVEEDQSRHSAPRVAQQGPHLPRPIADDEPLGLDLLGGRAEPGLTHQPERQEAHQPRQRAALPAPVRALEAVDSLHQLVGRRVVHGELLAWLWGIVRPLRGHPGGA